MNERIQKLAEEASKHVTVTVPFDNPSYAELSKLLASQDNTVLNAFKEKFAELILQECKLFCGHDSEGVSAMFKHFGVEE